MSDSTNVGSITAKLVLDGDEFQRKLGAAKDEARQLDGKNIKLKADVDTAKAQASLEALAIADGKLRIAQLNLDKVNKDSAATEQQKLRAENALIVASQGLNKAIAARRSLLDDDTDSEKKNSEAKWEGVSALSAMVALSPVALGGAAALAAGATGLGLGFTAMGAAGLLAVKGVKDEMAQGTEAGDRYSAGILTLKDDLDQLGHTSALAMLHSFDGAVANINDRMPVLNRLTGDLGSALGNVTGGALDAFLTGLERAEPLIDDGALYLSRFVGWLDQFATSQGFGDFLNYAQANLPGTVNLIENLVTTAGHIVAAFAPLGPDVIGILNGVTGALNALPLPVLAGLAAGALSIGPAFTIAKGAVAVFGETSALSALQVSALGVSVNLAVPVVGILAATLAGIAVASATAASSTQSLTVATQTYTQAVKDDNNTIGENVRLKAAQELASDGAAASAERQGISLKTLLDTTLGNADASKELNAALDTMDRKMRNIELAGQTNSDTYKHLVTDSQVLRGAVDSNSSAIHNAVDAARLMAQMDAEGADAKQGNTSATQSQTSALQALATQYNTTVGAIMAAQIAQQGTAGATSNATLQMQFENNAAGLLKQALDALNGGHLNLMQAQTNAAKATNSVTQSFKQNGKAIDGTTDAALANQSALQQKAQADQAAAQATAQATGKTEDGTKAYAAAKDQLEQNMQKQGLLTDAVKAYIEKLYDVNDFKPTPTKLEVDTSQALAQIAIMERTIQSVHDRTIHMTVVNDQINTTSSADGLFVGNGSAPQAHAHGGWISYLAAGGPANPYARGTDTVPAMLTPGEFVVRRPSAQSVGAGTLDYINRHGQLPPQQQQAPVIVQPVVHVYLDGRDITANMVTKIQQEIGAAARDAAYTRIGNA
ncbi:hypothetical protein SPF06_02475 [Sinomonas sp. JGH33]|uniref:Bacteriophage tail tape measure N-terminal domain-containing protein n=1 Tax=Sinomonas terricola TaxID=3110330 RepID=A0ABU5T1Q8_9MICC|nr:hypothetical protein [Sinomonas sp. JGH33]MEA5453578.1 hypothetical protein [Sinomonas sp. JGH33]